MFKTSLNITPVLESPVKNESTVSRLDRIKMAKNDYRIKEFRDQHWTHMTLYYIVPTYE